MTPPAAAPTGQIPGLPPERPGTPKWRIALRVCLVVALVVLLGGIGWRGFSRGDFTAAAATPTATTGHGSELGTATTVPTTPPVPSPSPTPTPPPAVPAPAEPPAEPAHSSPPATTSAPKLAVTSIDASPTSVMCPTPSATSDSNTYVTISWSSTGGQTAYIGVNTSDAAAAPYTTVSLNDSYTLYFPCSERRQTYTVTVVDAKGNRQSQSVEVSNGGYVG